jgi:hypothetical protein
LSDEIMALEIERLKIWRSYRREPKKCRDASGGYRTAEQIALHLIATMISKERFDDGTWTEVISLFDFEGHGWSSG